MEMVLNNDVREKPICIEIVRGVFQLCPWCGKPQKFRVAFHDKCLGEMQGRLGNDSVQGIFNYVNNGIPLRSMTISAPLRWGGSVIQIQTIPTSSREE